MLRAAPLLILTLEACGAAPSTVPRKAAHPIRVMSTNLCADQLILALLPPDRIASVTWLARDPGTSLMTRAARRVAVNHGTAEEVLAERPDLVVAGRFSTPALRGMLHRLDYPLLEIDDPTTLADVRRVTREVAAAVDARARGEALIAAMDREFAMLARDPAPAIRVAAWDRSGFSAGAGTLYDAILTAAGARNVARDQGSLGGHSPDVETLLKVDPALLVQGGPADGATLGDDVARPRIVREHWRGRTVTVQQSAYLCGTPMLAAAATRLRDDLRAAVERMGSTRR